MPNHVINEVRLHKISLAACRDIVLNAKGEIDFSILLPLPVNYWPGSVGMEHKKAFPGTWLDAASSTWGTKWNAYGLSEGGRYVSADETADGDAIFTFQTAWRPPRGWIVALFNTLKCDVTARWLSEGCGDAHVEIYRFSALDEKMGEPWEDTMIPEGSTEHRRLHKLLWGVEEFVDEDGDSRRISSHDHRQDG